MDDHMGGASGWVVGCCLTLVLALHLFEPALPVTWGYAHLGRVSGLPVAALAAVVLALALVPMFLAARWAQEPMLPYPVPVVLSTAAALTVALVGVGIRWPTPAISIDSPLYAIAVARGDTNVRCMLNGWVLGHLVRRLHDVVGRDQLLLAVSGTFGAATLLALAGAARRLGRTRGEVAVITGLAWTAFGTLHMCFGVIDEYPIAVLLTALFFWTALRALDGDGHPAWPCVIGLTGVFWYIGLVLLVPGVLVLLASLVWTRNRTRSVAVSLVIGIVACGAATMPVYGTPFAWAAFLADVKRASAYDVGASPTSSLLPPSVLFSSQHALDVANTWILLDPVGILALVGFGPWIAWRAATWRAWDAKAGVIAAVAAGQLAYVATMDTLMGALPEWDLFSYGTAATSLLGGWALVQWGREHSVAFRWLAGLALAVAAVHLLARLHALDVDLPRHLVESPPTVHLDWPQPGAPHGRRAPPVRTAPPQ